MGSQNEVATIANRVTGIAECLLDGIQSVPEEIPIVWITKKDDRADARLGGGRQLIDCLPSDLRSLAIMELSGRLSRGCTRHTCTL